MGLILLGLLGAAGYAVSLYAWPYAPHRRCGGTGRNRGSNRRRFGTCKSHRCQNGRVQRYGSRAVHRAVRAASSRRK